MDGACGMVRTVPGLGKWWVTPVRTAVWRQHVEGGAVAGRRVVLKEMASGSGLETIQNGSGLQC
jgi:hypothetical protein